MVVGGTWGVQKVIVVTSIKWQISIIIDCSPACGAWARFLYCTTYINKVDDCLKDTLNDGVDGSRNEEKESATGVKDKYELHSVIRNRG